LNPLTWVAIGLVRLYQLTLGKMMPAVCRFTPSCSQYMIESLRRKGFVRGLFAGLARLLRCGPWHPGGYDPVR
jgi:putative membrane protein insertion efficiency factor